MVNIIFLFLSALGVLDASYLTIQHYSRDPFVCPIFGGCDEVTNSIYSEIFGIPIALFGALYYFSIFIFSLVAYLSDNKNLLHIISGFTVFGLITSVYLMFIMIVVIKAICFYCVVSALTSTLLFVTGLVNLLSWRKRKILQKDSEKN